MNKVVEQDISSEFAEAEVDRDVDTDAAPTDAPRSRTRCAAVMSNDSAPSL